MKYLILTISSNNTLALLLIILMADSVQGDYSDKIPVSCSQHANCISYCKAHLGFNKGPSCCLVEKIELEDRETTVDLGTICYCCENWPESVTDFSKYPAEFTSMNGDVCEWYREEAILPGLVPSKSVLTLTGRRDFCGECSQAWISVTGTVSRRDVPSACMLSLDQRLHMAADNRK